MLINSVATDEYYVVLDINVLINIVATDEYYVVLAINVLIKSVAVDEYYVVLDIDVLIISEAMDEYCVVLGRKEKQNGNVPCYARQSVNRNHISNGTIFIVAGLLLITFQVENITEISHSTGASINALMRPA